MIISVQIDGREVGLIESDTLPNLISGEHTIRPGSVWDYDLNLSLEETDFMESLREDACDNCDSWQNGYDAGTENQKLNTQCNLKEEENLQAKWYRKGQLSIQRRNKSGCCCIIDDNDKVVSVCRAHKQWRETAITQITGK